MKNFKLVLIVVLGVALFILSACKDPVVEPVGSELVITDVTINGVDYKKLEGNFDANYTLSSDTKWVISGGVFVKDGITLTIEAGTMIYAADDATTPFLSVKQGGKINAVGTAVSPIVFTSIKSLDNTAAPGDWGGIIINGYAQINNGATAEGEGGTGTYGGSDDTDNSGTISYVRVEYAGKILGTDNELNGFSFNGCGSGTTVDHVEAYMGSDDGFEFFGGTVSVKYAVSVGNEDDSFDWTQGWRGNGQFWVVKQDGNAGDRGIEGDNNGDDNTLIPFSSPKLANITLVGFDDGDGKNQGMKLREGTRVQIINAIVTGFPKRGIQVEHDQTLTNLDDNTLTVASTIVDNTNSWVYTASDGTTAIPTNLLENVSTNSSNAVTLTGVVGVEITNAADASTVFGIWFTSANYIGAVDPANNWTDSWTVGL